MKKRAEYWKDLRYNCRPYLSAPRILWRNFILGVNCSNGRWSFAVDWLKHLVKVIPYILWYLLLFILAFIFQDIRAHYLKHWKWYWGILFASILAYFNWIKP